ncbi:MAG TPA: uracil-DNA glycosylase [Patescibacteria group bacterium]
MQNYNSKLKINKQEKLNKIAQEIENCDVCKIGKQGKPVPGEGNPDADVVFIGEAPGKKEAETGRPFIGRSGQLLRSLIRGIGLDDEKDVYITSPVKYLPNRSTPTSKDIAHGRFHLMRQFAVIKPKVVMLLGRVAAEGVLERKVAVASDHGQVIEEKEEIKYFLTFHPAAALRFPKKYKSLLEEDFKKLKKLIAHE